MHQIRAKHDLTRSAGESRAATNDPSATLKQCACSSSIIVNEPRDNNAPVIPMAVIASCPNLLRPHNAPRSATGLRIQSAFIPPQIPRTYVVPLMSDARDTNTRVISVHLSKFGRITLMKSRHATTMYSCGCMEKRTRLTAD